MTDFVSIKNLISGVWGMFGGGVTAYFTTKFGDRKFEARSIADLALEVEGEAKVYWRGASEDRAIEQELVRLTHRFQSRVLHFADDYLLEASRRTVSGHVLKVLKLCTGANFGVKGRPADPQRLGPLSLEVRRLLNTLRRDKFVGTLRHAIPLR